MILAKVVGTVVTTLSHRDFKNRRLLVVQPLTLEGDAVDEDFIALDTTHAGIGDTVLINTASQEPKDGIAFAVNYEGEAVIKRLVRDAGQWWLVSDNPDQTRYPRKVCDEHVRIVGEVVQKQSLRI